jgi:tyrosyl-tRNA synthetase
MKVQAVHELCSEPRAPTLGAQVATVVSLFEAPANHRKATTVAKKVTAIKYGNTTGNSIKKILESPFAGKYPKLISKGTKAAAAEAAVTAAEAMAMADLEEANRLATEFEALGGGALTMALAQEAEPGGPLTRVLARTRAAPRVGGPLDRPRGYLDGPYGRCR